MSDQSVIVRGNGTIFLGGPARQGRYGRMSAEDLGERKYTRKCLASRITSQKMMNTPWRSCDIVRTLHHARSTPWQVDDCENPLRPGRNVRNHASDARKAFDVREIIARLVDGSNFDEFKALYGTTLVTGFARLMGFPVGIIANNGILFSESALKATHFIELCTQRRIPLCVLAEHYGFMVGRVREPRHRKRRSQDGDGRGKRKGAEVHGYYWRLIRSRKLRDVRTRI
jgi:acetyl-CoA carboxylase carboxyltransferase component